MKIRLHLEDEETEKLVNIGCGGLFIEDDIEEEPLVLVKGVSDSLWQTGGSYIAPRNCPSLHPIQIQELLGRGYDESSFKLSKNYIKGKTVLVTGAGGSIGSELCRQICSYGPARIILLGRGENRIHWIYNELNDVFNGIEIIPVIANITSIKSLDEVWSIYKPDIVFHAAAHKHVYLMENNPCEAARNNIIGTANVASVCEFHNTKVLVGISTDKAADPVSVMGLTKRGSEIVLLTNSGNTRKICVRFGNVIGSEGSVLQIFEWQWASGKPLTVFSDTATRYFMSISEACFLVLESVNIENGNLFILDMGDPISILELAKKIITIRGGDPEAPGSIQVSSLKPGEKVHETLVGEGEQIKPTSSSGIMEIVFPEGWFYLNDSYLYNWLQYLYQAIESNNQSNVLALLKVIPDLINNANYRPLI